MRVTTRRWGLLDLAFVAFLAVAVIAARAPTLGTQLAQGGSGGSASGGSGGGSASGGSGGGSAGGGSGGGSGAGSNSGGSGGGSNSGSSGGGSNGGGSDGTDPDTATTLRPGTTRSPSTTGPSRARPPRPQGTRPYPSDAELAALTLAIPLAGFVAVYETLATMPPFLLLACLEGLTYAILQIPPEDRFRDPFLPDSPNQAVRDHCSRFDVRPLQAAELSSGASSRPIEPSDVRLDVRVLPDRIEVRERLRETFGPVQLLLATLALLALLVVATAAGATERRRRRSRRIGP